MLKHALLSAGLVGVAMVLPARADDMVGEAAPDIAVKEWLGKKVAGSLRDLRGKAVLIEFFATW